jgi:NADH:ubiquinone oxidoreductase subunit 3 (subunit A)
MIPILLIPPVAFLLYLVLVSILSGLGRVMAGHHPASSAAKAGPYASGEAPHLSDGAPGYRPFFQGALFFAVLHLGVLVLGSGGMSLVEAVYLVGLMLALVALILG